jgi:hypothetical protein
MTTNGERLASMTVEERAENFRAQAAVARQNAASHEIEVETWSKEYVRALAMKAPGIHASPAWADYWTADAEWTAAKLDQARATVAQYQAEARKFNASACIVETEAQRG